MPGRRRRRRRSHRRSSRTPGWPRGLLFLTTHEGGVAVTHAAITGWGKCLPPAVLSNHDLSSLLDTSDEWIVSRTGIRERRISHVGLEELAYVAAARALAAAGVCGSRIELVVFGTCSHEDQVPNMASGLQVRIGAPAAAAFDINTACTSFLYGITRWQFEGQEIFKRAVQGMSSACEDTLTRLNFGPQDVDLVVPHQANLRIIEAVAKRAQVPMERVNVNIQRYGNMSAATVPVALCEALEEQRVRPGALLLVAGVGGGPWLCAHPVRWGRRPTPPKTSTVELPADGP